MALCYVIWTATTPISRREEGHPSDMIPAALAPAGPAGCDGQTFITSVVLAYEVFCRLSDQVVASSLGWDQGMFGVIGAACAAGKVLGLDREQMAHAVSLALVPNLPLGVTPHRGNCPCGRDAPAAAAARAGVFAAQLAAEGMTGPRGALRGPKGAVGPSGGQSGAGRRRGSDPANRSLSARRRSSPTPPRYTPRAPFRLALELRPQVAVDDVASVMVHAYRSLPPTTGSPTRRSGHPKTRETADHSIPYLISRWPCKTAQSPGRASPMNDWQDPSLAALDRARSTSGKMKSTPGGTRRS